MKFTNRQVIMILGGVVLLGLVLFFFFSGAGRKPVQPAVTLTVWGVDNSSAIQPLIDEYKKLRSNVQVTYTQLPANSYYARVVDALAAGNGPDVFMIHNRMVPMALNKLMPAATSTITVDNVRALYPTVVEQDFTNSGNVYALPLYLDTLALFYNKDLLDQGGIMNPPQTWGQFQADVPLLTKKTNAGQITQSGAAMGGSNASVHAGTDLAQLLMMQNLWQANGMMLGQGAADFYSGAGNRGLDGFKFYLQFANPSSAAYSWSDTMGNSLDQFAAGKTALAFGYWSDLAELKAKSPYLNFHATPMPQIDNGQAVNYADYWGLAVSKQSPVYGWGWDFVVFATTDQTANQGYLTAAARLPALKSLIQTGNTDPEANVFLRQALTARSWWQPNEYSVTDIMNGAIQNVLSGQLSPENALQRAEEQVNQLLR